MNSRYIKLLILFLGSALLLYIIYILVAPKLVNKMVLIEKISQQALALTGKQLIMGNIDVEIISGGKIIIDGIAIRNEADANAAYFLKADKLIIHIDMINALLGGDMKIDTVEILGPKVDMERYADGRYNWSFLQQAHKEGASLGLDGVKLMISDASVSFTERQTNFTDDVKGINGALTFNNNQISADFTGINHDINYSFSGICSLQRFNHIGDFDSECSLALSGGVGAVNYSGRVIAAENHFRHKGTIKLNANDGRAVVELFEIEQPSQQQTKKVKKETAIFKGNAIPLSVDIESYSDENQWIFNVNNLQAGGSNGKGTFTYDMTKTIPTAAVNIFFEKLDMDELLGNDANDGLLTNKAFASPKGFSKNFAADFDFKARSLVFRGSEIQNMVVAAQMAEGEIVLSDAKAILPGKGSVILLGRVSTGKDGIDYTGQVEAHGAEFTKLMPMLGIDDERIPKDILGEYRSRFNIIIRPESTTISELRLLLMDKVQVSGGVNMYHKGKQKLDATITLRYIDLDPILAAWRGSNSLFVAPEKQPDHPFGFKWLRNLDRQVALTINLDNFKLIGLDGDDTRLAVNIADNMLEVKGIDLKLDTSRIQGKMSIAVPDKAPRPVVKAQLNISRLNLDDAFMKAIHLAEGADQYDGNIWSREPIDLSPLHYFDGEAELRIRQLDHQKFHAFNFRTLAKLEDFKLHMQDIKMSLWSGDAEADVIVDSSVVPGMNLSYSMSNGQIRDVMKSFVDYANIAGTVSLSGKLNFSGVNFQNWLDHMTGHLAIDGRNLLVQHFNLPSIVRAVDAVRAVSSLSNSIRLAFDEGSTWIGNINGTTYFGDGQLKTTKISFRTNESVGEVEGSFDIRKWTLDMAVKFGLNTLAQVNYPVFIVNFTGPFNMPDHTLNTKSVEAFIARKAH